MDEKQVLEAQIEQLRGQLKDASATTTNLQSQPKISGALQVDVDPIELLMLTSWLKTKHFMLICLMLSKKLKI